VTIDVAIVFKAVNYILTVMLPTKWTAGSPADVYVST
jgi:hypothetical protein